MRKHFKVPQDANNDTLEQKQELSKLWKHKKTGISVSEYFEQKNQIAKDHIEGKSRDQIRALTKEPDSQINLRGLAFVLCVNPDPYVAEIGYKLASDTDPDNIKGIINPLPEDKDNEDWNEPYYEKAVMNGADRDSEVDLDHWLLLLSSIPASSVIWSKTDEFARSLIDLTERKILEQNDVKGIIEALEGFKERCSQELAYHEMVSALAWSTEKMNAGQLKNVAADLLGFEQLLKERVELMSQPVLNKHEEQQQRKVLDEMDEDIDSMFKRLDYQLNIVEESEPALVEIDMNLSEKNRSSKINKRSTKTKKNTELKTQNDFIGRDKLVQSNKAQAIKQLENENDYYLSGNTNIDDKFDIGNSDSMPTLIETMASVKVKTPEGIGELVSPTDGSSVVDQTDSVVAEETNKPVNSSTDQEDDKPHIAIEDKEQNNSSKAGTGNSENDKLTRLYNEIQNDCIKPLFYPKAWLLIKNYEQYGGAKDNLEKLPTCSLLELAYVAQRAHQDPGLYPTYRTHIEKLDVSLNASSFSKNQTLMYFATALPLSLVYDHTSLRSTFYYADNIPDSFQDMYSSLVEKANKVTIPIIDLRGTEEKHRLSRQQRRKLGGDLLLIFDRGTRKSKTKIDNHFFPRYGNGPLHWVKNAVEVEECTEEFIQRLESANAELIFSEFTDPKLAGITPLREKTVERINSIITLAKAWAGTFSEIIEPDAYQIAAFQELTCLLEENFNQWITKLAKQEDESKVAAFWMKQSLERLYEQIRGVNYAVEFAG